FTFHFPGDGRPSQGTRCPRSSSTGRTRSRAEHAVSVQVAGSLLPFAGGLGETVICQSVDPPARASLHKRGRALVTQRGPTFFPRGLERWTAHSRRLARRVNLST